MYCNTVPEFKLFAKKSLFTKALNNCVTSHMIIHFYHGSTRLVQQELYLKDQHL